MVRGELPNGFVFRYEGDKGNARLVHCVHPGGLVEHYSCVLPTRAGRRYDGGMGVKRLLFDLGLALAQPSPSPMAATLAPPSGPVTRLLTRLRRAAANK